MKARFAAVLPCAGKSSRMGAFKPLLPLGRQTLLEHVLATVSGVVAPEAVRVVLGHRAEKLAPLVQNAGATVVHNPDFEQGMFSSVCAGVRSLTADTDAFFLLPVDIPLVRPATLRRLAAAWRRHPGRVLHPVFGGRRGHPPLIPAELSGAILKSPGQGGLRSVLESHEEQAVAVPVADANILFDLDRPEDHMEARRRYARRNDPSAAECEAILTAVYPTDEKIIRHGRRVQQAALALCRAMNRAGAGLDEKRVAAAALLHDIAKGAPDHARAGARLLEALGFDRVGAIVAAHTDLPAEAVQNPQEAAVVYLADKLVGPDRFVSLESRFDAALRRFGQDPAARAAIAGRRAQALAVQTGVEQRAGRPLEQVLAEGGIRLDAG